MKALTIIGYTPVVILAGVILLGVSQLVITLFINVPGFDTLVFYLLMGFCIYPHIRERIEMWKFRKELKKYMLEAINESRN